MALKLYFHPLASFCHKVLIALYEKNIAFEPVIVDFGNPESAAAFRKVWPMAKMPALVDGETGQVVAETTIVLEYLERKFPQEPILLPADPDDALQVRFWDRFYDFYVELPMQKIVTDWLRPEGSNDTFGVEQAYVQLREAYGVIDGEMASREWAAGDVISIADCAAAPALFYANTVEPIGDSHGYAKAYLTRLMQRPSFSRALIEAEPYFKFFPMPQRPDMSPARGVGQ
jgi:glutathione S-transferase